MAKYYLNSDSATEDGLTPETGYHKMGSLLENISLFNDDEVEFVTDIREDAVEIGFEFTSAIHLNKYSGTSGKPVWDISYHTLTFDRSVYISDLVLTGDSISSDWTYIYATDPLTAEYSFNRCAFSSVYITITLQSESVADIKNNIFYATALYITKTADAAPYAKVINNTFYKAFFDTWSFILHLPSVYDQLHISVPGKVLNNLFYSPQWNACAWNYQNLSGGSNLTVDYSCSYTFVGEGFSGIIPYNIHIPVSDFVGLDQFLKLHNIRNTDPKIAAVSYGSYNPLPQPDSPCVRSGLGNDDDSDIPTDDYNGDARSTDVTEIGAIMVKIYPDFSGDPLSGRFPLNVKFTDLSTSNYGSIALYLWDFGDGTTSADRSPTHAYTMPGTYTVSLTITDEMGYSAKITKEDYIRVYDFDVSGEHAAYTDKSYRLASSIDQGVSITEYGGERWLWPPAFVGTCKGYDGDNDTISLVLDNYTGKFYRIGISDLWKDRENWPYGGYDIPCHFKLKEHTSQAGEYEEVKHIESHVYSRPYWEDNRDKPGFNSDGFIDGFEMDLQMYENGNPTTHSAKIQNVPQYGDYVYRRREEARRLQLEILTNASAFRIIGVNQHLLCVDKKAPPLLNNPVESQYQREFRTPYFWISRDKSRPTLNRATGRTCSGTYDLLLAGPDTIAKSAIAFAAAHSLSDDIADLSSDFTAGVWLNGIVGYPCIVFRITDGTTTLDLSISAAGYMRWDDGTNVFTAAISWIGAGWVFVAWQKDGHYVRFFENGIQSTYYGMIDDSMTYGGTVSMPVNSTITVFDPRIVPRAVSSNALLYYYQKVLVDTGNEVLPIVR